MRVGLSLALSQPVYAGGGASAPVLTGAIFTPGGSGAPDQLELAYTGSTVGFRVYMATGTNPLTVSAAQLYAGSGGTNTLEFADAAPGTNVDIAGFTATSNSATRLAVALIRESDGGLASDVEIVTVSGLDFTLPTLSSATTNSAGTLVTLTMSENIFGTESTANWSVERNGTPQTPSAVDITGSSIALTVTGLLSGETITVNYSGGDLEDGKGNPLASISDGAVTNTVPSAVGFEAPTAYTQQTDIRSGGTPSQTTSGVFAGAGDYLVCLASEHDVSNNSAFTLSGTGLTSTLLTSSSAAKTGRVGTFIYWVTTTGASDLTVTETANFTSQERRIVVMKANGLTNTGAIVNSSASLSTPFSTTLAAVPAGHHVAAITANRGVVMTDHAYSGSFVSGDRVYFALEQTFDNFSVSVAEKEAASTGTFTSTVALSPSAGHSVMSAVALDPL